MNFKPESNTMHDNALLDPYGAVVQWLGPISVHTSGDASKIQ
jgi:hypothetical protein